MKHTTWIITAEKESGAVFFVPFLMPALRWAASGVCEDIRIVSEAELDASLRDMPTDTFGLLLRADMPLVTKEDCRLLLHAAQESEKNVCGKNTGTPYPCCIRGGYKTDDALPLAELNCEAAFRVQTPTDLAQALEILHRQKNDALMNSGVILLDPARTYIDMDVEIGSGTVVHPNNTLTGGTSIGAGCVLLPNNRIHAARIGDKTTVESSVLTECFVGSKTTVGPFAYLRPGAQIGSNCRVGDFVEIKNSVIGDKTKVSHLTYVGDSDLGQGINLGCGVVFVNYDGKHKHRSTVGDNAFIGCNVNLVSPVHVGEGAYVAAGTTVTDDVPGGALAIGRAKQSTKEGWVMKRKMEGKL